MKKTLSCFIAAMILIQLMVFTAAAEETQCKDFDYSLPKAFFIPEETITENKCSIICRDVGRVGGIIRTDLDTSVLLDFMTSFELGDVLDYLRQYVPDGYDLEYMASINNTLNLDFILVNLETMETREFKHVFFEKNEAIYDLWLDTRYLSGKDICEILVSTEIDPSANYVGETPSSDVPNDFDISEEFTLEKRGDSNCVISFDGNEVGGINATGIPLDMFLSCEKDTFWDNFQETENGVFYMDDTPSEFATVRYLAETVPDDCYFEYIMMYLEDDSGNPVLSISFAVTNMQTEERKEYSHTVFEKDSNVLDIWFDCSMISEKDAAAFRNAVIK